MAFNKYRAADLESGHTVPMILDMLAGEPEIDVEHLGDTNRTYLADAIAKANAKATRTSGTGAKLMSKARLEEQRRERRETLKKHVVRHLRATHDDGAAATDGDIADWVDSIPSDVVDIVYVFALNAENFRRNPAPESGAVKELAEK